MKRRAANKATPEQHALAAEKLWEMREMFFTVEKTLGWLNKHEYPQVGSITGVEAQALSKVLGAIDRARCKLDSLLARDHPREFSPKIYYPGREGPPNRNAAPDQGAAQSQPNVHPDRSAAAPLGNCPPAGQSGSRTITISGDRVDQAIDLGAELLGIANEAIRARDPLEISQLVDALEWIIGRLRLKAVSP